MAEPSSDVPLAITVYEVPLGLEDHWAVLELYTHGVAMMKLMEDGGAGVRDPEATEIWLEFRHIQYCQFPVVDPKIELLVQGAQPVNVGKSTLPVMWLDFNQANPISRLYSALARAWE